MGDEPPAKPEFYTVVRRSDLYVTTIATRYTRSDLTVCTAGSVSPRLLVVTT